MTKKPKTAQEIELAIAVARSKIGEIDKKIKPLQNARDRQYNTIKRMQDQLRSLNKGDFGFLLYDINAWDEIQAFIPKNRQLLSNGYTSVTMEQYFEVRLEHDAEIHPDTIKFIEMWLQHTKGFQLGIRRYDLCRHGSWVMILRDGQWQVFDQRDEGRSWFKIEFTGDLMGALQYVREHHHADDIYSRMADELDD